MTKTYPSYDKWYEGWKPIGDELTYVIMALLSILAVLAIVFFMWMVIIWFVGKSII